ncbi:MAG TPA: PLP-dependent aminotransferase family protein [Spirochaetia bacterium]|nr:PLP-dependent aminotransferase family protein [Spirochaetia bacterium]
MIVDLDRNDPTPLYIQIKNRLADLIRSGQLGPGSRLPSTRDLAGSMGVNRNTIISAYQELEIEGFVSSHVGRGTAVREHVPGSPAPARAQNAESMRVEALLSTTWRSSYPHLPAGTEQLLEAGSGPHAISFASHEPDLSLFPTEEFAQCLQSAMRKHGADLLAAGSPRGFQPLVEYLPRLLARRGIRCSAEEVMVVNGIQQGLSVVGRLFVDPGDTVLMENLSYPAALGVFRSLQASCVGIPIDDDGLRVDLAGNVLARRSAKLLYTIPTYHNPTGAVLSAERRERLLELAREHQLLIVEDDYVHELCFDGREVLPLKARDAREGVISMGSFSEILAPGLRLSWIVAPAPIIDRLLLVKQFADLYSNRILQGALLEFCEKGLMEKHLKRKQAVYRRRRDLMADAMKLHFPPEVTWKKSRGGLFQWVDLPRGMDSLALLLRTRARGVVFAPDRLFSVEEWERAGLRLGFAGIEDNDIEKGIRIIGEEVKASLAKGRGRKEE